MRVKVFEEYQIDTTKLLDYGFVSDEDNYIYREETIDDLSFEIVINAIKEEFIIEVKDEENETYDLFNVENANAYASKLQQLGVLLIDDIKSKCFLNLNIKFKVIEYIKNKYNVDPEFPFPEDNVTMVFKNEKRKWFVLYMNIKYKSLGIDSNELVDVINVKASEEDINNLIDNKCFFKAYHMNKKKWMTICLIKNTPLVKICEQIDKSFTLVMK